MPRACPSMALAVEQDHKSLTLTLTDKARDICQFASKSEIYINQWHTSKLANYQLISRKILWILLLNIMSF